MVGELYPEGGARRDTGFSIYYMGINLGAFLGPFVCGTLGEKFNWHYGFGAAGVGMVLGLAQYRFLQKNLGAAGAQPGHAGPLSQKEKIPCICAIAALGVIIALGFARVIRLDPVALANGTTTVLVIVAILFFGVVLFFGKLEKPEKLRIGVIVVICAAVALFWAGYEQAGSSFNLFAERYTRRALPHEMTPSILQPLVRMMHDEIAASWFQALSPIFVIAFAPVFAAMWVRLARQHLDPSLPMKFAFGLIFLALGFLVIAGAAVFVARGQKVAPTWLTMTYLLHVFGELCVSPVGLSSVTKLAPKKLVGRMMGAWFLAASLGNLIAGRLAGEIDPNALGKMPGQFLRMVLLPAVVAVVIIAFSRPIRRMMGGVK